MARNTSKAEAFTLHGMLDYLFPSELRMFFVAITALAMGVLRFEIEPGKISWQGSAAASMLIAHGFFMGVFHGNVLGKWERWGWPVPAAVATATAWLLFTVAKVADVGVTSWFDFGYQTATHAFVGFLLGHGIGARKLALLGVAAALIIVELVAAFIY